MGNVYNPNAERRLWRKAVVRDLDITLLSPENRVAWCEWMKAEVERALVNVPKDVRTDVQSCQIDIIQELNLVKAMMYGKSLVHIGNVGLYCGYAWTFRDSKNEHAEAECYERQHAKLVELLGVPASV